VVTNAHVVAGVGSPRVDRRDRPGRVATVVAFDERNDVAILRVPGLAGRPLPLAQPERKVAVVLVGYPGNGPLTRTPGRLGGTRELISRDAYGRGPVTRPITTIRGLVEPGSSGGPGVDAQGRVRTTVFARQPGERGGYGIPAAAVLDALEDVRSGSVPATACTR
jgi:S1-C subfamily serine protease